MRPDLELFIKETALFWGVSEYDIEQWLMDYPDEIEKRRYTNLQQEVKLNE